MRLIIAGGRDIVDQFLVSCNVESVWFEKIDEVVCGGARGVDTLGKNWAISKGIPVKMFPADWTTHGKSAGPIRNVEMAEYADALIAVWDGSSKGTRHMINTMLSLGKEVHVFIYKGEQQ